MFRKFFVRSSAFIMALSISISFFVAMPAFAGSATPSDADPVDSWPDRNFYALHPYISDDGVSTYSDGITVTKIANTVSFSGAIMMLYYYNSSGSQSFVTCNISSDGYFYFDKPSDYVSPASFDFRLRSSNLPVTGNYAFAWNLIMDTGVTYRPEPAGTEIYSVFRPLNVSLTSKTVSVISSSNYDHEDLLQSGNGNLTTYYGKNGSLIQHSSYGEFYGYVPSIGFINVSNLVFQPFMRVSSISFPCSGYLRCSFASTGQQPVITTPGTSISSSDIQQGISDQVSDISSGVSQISSSIQEVASGIAQTVQGILNLPSNISTALEPHYDNILQQIQHITDQLHAFWDQLAAYFNDKLIPQMVTDTNRIVEAIENIDLEVNVSLTELMNTLNKNHQEQLANDNKNHQEQLANDDKNTDQIVNGYDSSDFADANDKLSDTLNKYGEEEDKLLDEVKSYVDEFEYENPFDKLTKPLYDISMILNLVYVGLGGLNIPIAFNLTLSIALICIGWYRFRGG